MRKFTKYPKKTISAAYGSTNKIILSKSELTQQITNTFNKFFGGVSVEDNFNPAEDYCLRIDIHEEECGSVSAPYNCVVIDIEAETYFDENEVLMDYSEYKSIMEEIGQPAMSRSEYYRDLSNRATLEDKMNEVVKAYNPEWYFELWNATRIQAYLDNAVLEA